MIEKQNLLGAEDPAPFRRANLAGRAPLLLVCDHAGRAVPVALGGLGLPAAALSRHIAVDIGAAGLTRRLARQLNGRAVLARYSRLVWDCNRKPDDADTIPELADGQSVPGNMGLAGFDKVRRRAEIYEPYHGAISLEVARLVERGPPPAVISIHSFTPEMEGKKRPWHVGVLWNRDGRLAKPLMAALRAHPEGLCIGDNEPYSGRLVAYTLDHHAVGAGLPHCALEMRQDLLATRRGIDHWAGLLGSVLGPILANPDLYRIKYY
ncbi:MAG: N-formylglutamate amidohydrolase [Rhodospirillales bacterium]|nr:N-formylglutamate amidohydrolase [Rhodospirillales bacterium]